MKARIAFFLLLMTTQAFAGGRPHYYCYEDNGTTLSITVDLSAKTATLLGENTNRVFTFAGAVDSSPAQYVYGLPQDCTIQFVPLGDGHTGLAAFRCNERKYPRAAKLNMECTFLRQ